jgi:hypothetical protein
MLIGAIGCNIAWGIVDAVIYIVTTLVKRSRSLTTLHSIRNASSPEHAYAIITDVVSPGTASVFATEELEAMLMGPFMVAVGVAPITATIVLGG